MTEVTYCLDDLPESLRTRIVVNPVTGCWEWQGAPHGGGYGRIKIKGKEYPIHRFVYTLLVKPIPARLTIDHVKARGCRSRMCCWPAHLEPVPRGVNSNRGDGPTGRNSRKARCGNGHKYTPENTFIRKDGRRDCRECMRDRARQDYYRRAEREGRMVKPRGPYRPKGATVSASYNRQMALFDPGAAA